MARYVTVPHNAPIPTHFPPGPGRFARSRTLLRTLGFGTLALAACGGPSGGGGPGNARVLLTLENIYRDARGGVFSAAISPDGRWVAAVAESADGRGIHLLDLTEDPPVARFWLSGSSPAWSRDSRHIAFLRDGNLFRAPVGDPDAVQLTDGLAGVRAPAWSPDGATVAVMASASGSQDVWLVPAAGGDPRQLTSDAMTADEVRFGVSWSPDGRTVAYVGNKADYRADDVWLADVATGDERRLTASIRAVSTVPAWSPDGGRLAVLGVKNEEYWYLDIADLYLLDPAGGPEEPLPMSSFTTAYRFRPFWSGDGARLFFTHQERGEHHLWSVPAAGGAATRMTNLGGVFGSVTASAGAERFAFVRSSATEGSDLYTVPASGGPAQRRTRLSPVWEGVQSPREISYRSFDGHYIQGFLYLPPEVEAGGVCPALVQVHGGGTNSYLAGPNLADQYLASRGFVVLAVNYRGGSGFGREFQDLGDEDWLNEQALDPGAAAEWLREQPYVSGRVGIYGYSYGGMQSMAAITRTPDRFDAAAPMAGIYSERQTFEHQDRLGRIFTIDGHGGLPEERPEIYDKTETVARIGNITAPVLIQHGDRDVRAPFLNFELAVAAFEEHRIEYEAHTYPEGHGFRDPENRIALYRRVEDFFRRQLGSCR
ncbi:MAG: prolyl oligopeptidase family serine peptidase [Acidobacteriota bacterium]|nr:prolyl oligopeptidase family serine peptidase [Acidobacteriota bacterium]